MKPFFLIIFLSIVLIYSGCSSEIEITKAKIIYKPQKQDSVIVKRIQTYDLISFPYRYKINIKSFEHIDSSQKIIPAEIIGGENGFLVKIVYPEIAKRAEIEGIVIIEFTIDKEGNPNEINLIKDIGGMCGDETVNAVKITKFKPAKLKDRNVDSRYRMIVQFQMVPNN